VPNGEKHLARKNAGRDRKKGKGRDPGRERRVCNAPGKKEGTSRHAPREKTRVTSKKKAARQSCSKKKKKILKGVHSIETTLFE